MFNFSLSLMVDGITEKLLSLTPQTLKDKFFQGLFFGET
jgi:hypothetical protein